MLSIDFKKRQSVLKALCLHVAHDCNLSCTYCFAGEGEYHGPRGLMSFETGKRALDFLEPFGCKRFLAINPATPVYSLEEVLDYIDGIHLLMVNPGFAGQNIVPSTIKKAEKVMQLLKEKNHEDVIMEVDGNITLEHAEILSKIGASIFVAGTSCLFTGDIKDYAQNLEKLRKAINK